MEKSICEESGVSSQESGEKREERITTGEEGESFFITNYLDMILCLKLVQELQLC
ncbi:hypothetical protein [Okeania sp. SIO2B3]|uniref:hypothetical protein n=1 Tax=Okeania sp. SIO2B3 TaxID=2607784 RepID=UPI0013C14706|nr:hypothetical protein [Okeania sp. SIO2B3]NET42303.1 hypothetical protein [Okeania sp. SIO2B3]